MNSFMSDDELLSIGLKSFGTHALISRKASIYSPEKISIGNNVRVDDYCILSGNILIGNNVHIAAYSALYGGCSGISVGNFVNISGRCSIYATNDDYSGESLPGAVIPVKYKHVCDAPVKILDYSIIGASSMILPGITIGEGCAFGAYSFIDHDPYEWTVNAGIPAEKKYSRCRDLVILANEFERENDA